MEKAVTLRFFEVQRLQADRPALVDVIRKIAASKIADRGRSISDDIFVRLEDFSEDGACVEGQLVRGQLANRPGRMLDAGTENLPFSEPIGHGIAFRYRSTDGVLAIEYNPRVLSPGRAFEYFCAYEPRAEYALIAKLREDAWDEFEARPIRKLILNVAGHPNVAGADDPNSATWKNFGDMSERYGAHAIKIEISMGHAAGGLADNIKDLARDALSRFTQRKDDIRTLKAVVETADGEPNEEINLIADLMNVKADLSVPGNDWKKFYKLRRDLLRQKLDLV